MRQFIPPWFEDVALCAAAFEQGILPKGTCLADNNPAMIEAIIAYRAGVYDRMEEDGEEQRRKAETSTQADDLPPRVRRNVGQIQAAGGTSARPTGRRRKRRKKLKG